jgi:maltose O-acetyltransferase
MLSLIMHQLSRVRSRLDEARTRRRWDRLRAMGMHIGAGVNLPLSTWIDTSHCFLISIGDNCGFGPDCLLLAHDAQMDEFLDATRLGRVVIGESCHLGARCIVLPGVEIGPRTLVGAGSVVSKSLPPDSVCAGNPARVIASLDEYLAKHRLRLEHSPTFDYMEYDIDALTSERRRRMLTLLQASDGYMLGGHSAELRGDGGTYRTPGTGRVYHAIRGGPTGESLP